VTSTERLVLYNLSTYADKAGGSVFPSVARISRETSLVKRSVQKALLSLRDKGFIVADGKMARGSVRYVLALDAMAQHAWTDEDNRERGSQSGISDRERDSLSASDRERSSPGGEPGSPDRERSSGGGEPRSPDLEIDLPVEQENVRGAAARALTRRTDAPNPLPVRPLPAHEAAMLRTLSTAIVAEGGYERDLSLLVQLLQQRASQQGINADFPTACESMKTACRIAWQRESEQPKLRRWS